MPRITYLDRTTGRVESEEVYGAKALDILYGDTLLARLFGRTALHLFVKWPFFSWLYGYLQRLPRSVKKIRPFIDKFQVDESEFAQPVSSYASFNDFFTRKLKPSARPIAAGKDLAVIPADGRYLFYPAISSADGFVVKGKKFNLTSLLRDKGLASRYQNGAMVLARLCPSDYHRYHFPVDCRPGKTLLVNGPLYSVNPLAVRKRVELLAENRRTLCELQSESFGLLLFLEVGATCVGSIHHTYTPGQFYEKGDERGFFSFGASTLILLFEEGRIRFDEDLLAASQQHLEVRCLMGQPMGRAASLPHDRKATFSPG